MSPFILGMKHLLNNLLTLAVFSKTPKHRISGTSSSSLVSNAPLCRIPCAPSVGSAVMCGRARGSSHVAEPPRAALARVPLGLARGRTSGPHTLTCSTEPRTPLSASLPFFIKRKRLDRRDCLPLAPVCVRTHTHPRLRFLGHTPVHTTFSGTYTATQDAQSTSLSGLSCV